MSKFYLKNSGDFLPVKVFPFPSCKAYRRHEVSKSKLTIKPQLPKVTSLREFKPEYLNPKLIRPSSSSSVNKLKSSWSKFTNANPSATAPESEKAIRPVSACFFSQKFERKRKCTDKFFSRYCPASAHPLNFYSFDNKNLRNSKISIRDGIKELVNYDEENDSFTKTNEEKMDDKHSMSFEDKKPKVIVQAWVPQPIVYSMSSVN